MNVSPERVRQLRTIHGLSQATLAEVVGTSTATLNRFEGGVAHLPDELTDKLAAALQVHPRLLATPPPDALTAGPWLRAYADASKRAVDGYVEENKLVAEFVTSLRLRRVPDKMPTFTGDPQDEAEIEDFAAQVRTAAEIDEGAVVGNVTRAAERLGCLVIPTNDVVGRHMGMSMVVDGRMIIRAARPGARMPGDRHRFTVAHELGHLALHSEQNAPGGALQSKLVEQQAHRFAGAFLAPAEPLLDALRERGGRVTLNTLADLKTTWGVSIKALVVRFRQLGQIDDYHAQSLYKQISARGWNTAEPGEVGHESAIWLDGALTRAYPDDPNYEAGADVFGVASHVVRSWASWEPAVDADVIDLPAPKTIGRPRTTAGTVARFTPRS